MRRGRSKPRRRFDPTALRELMGEGPAAATVAIARVVADDDGAAFDIDVVGGQVNDITIELEIVPTEERITARYTAIAGSPLRGIFAMPVVGDEFLVVFVGGDRSNPVALSPLSGARYPISSQQATGSKVVIVGSEVIVTNAAGGAEEALVRKQEFLDHIHGTGVGPSAKPTLQVGIGTTVLKAK